MSYSTLIDLLEAHARTQPDKVAYEFLTTGEVNGDIDRRTYRDLAIGVRATAAALQSRELRGERVLLLYPPGLEFIDGFLGSLAAGTIAVPAPLPQFHALDRELRRLRQVIVDADISVVLTTRMVIDALASATSHIPELAGMTWIATEELPRDLAASWTELAVDPSSTAFLQYTSGSTSAPLAE